jgi:hypothetical protein
MLCEFEFAKMQHCTPADCSKVTRLALLSSNNRVMHSSRLLGASGTA